MTTLKITQVPVEELVPFAGNARRGNVDMIAESLQRNGQYKPIVVNRGTKPGTVPNEVLAGNHTLEAAKQIGLAKIAVVHVDVTRAEALRIVAVDNRSNDVATYDDEALAALLTELGKDGWEGSGFEYDDLAKLLDNLDVPDFNPDDDEDVRLDRKSVTTCPECGHTFTPVTRTETENPF